MSRLSTVRAATLGFALLFGASSVQASVVTYLLSGTTDSGDLTGQSYTGQFSFDDASLSGFAFESVALSTLSFTFQSTSFGLGNAAWTPTADFQDGQFLGVSYTVSAFDPEFSLISGSLDASDAYFAYTPSAGLTGYGSVTYTLAAPVPVPGAIWLMVSALPAVGAFVRRRHSSAC